MTTRPHHIIAIGASAGGMEEINSFFDHTPLDGVSYVIVQHLSPDFKSRMAELLAKHSKLKVLQAENEMLVKKNEVYLIPNDKFMTIDDSKLYLTDKEKVNGPHLTINRFFNSLANDFGKNAIAVVLSGMGSDGTEGIKAIKKGGGMVIVRNPDTTEFSSMPNSAIATGMVDFVLEPAMMPDKIEAYVKKEGELMTNEQEDEININVIVNLIKEQSPLDFSEYKQTTILRRIRRRALANNFTELNDYLGFLKTHPEEVDILAKDFLISVTSFFRDKEAFDSIQSDVLPAIFKKLLPNEELKIWITGCATGEEAYSIAILIYEQVAIELKDVVVKIFATDIDTAALEFAGKGVYGPDITKHISAKRIEKFFFKKEGDKFQVKPAIRKMVIFAQHDLVKNPPYCNMHFISCRNLLIYMTPALQKKIFQMLLFGLKMEGYLFLGSSENPISILQNLEVVNKKWKIYKNLETRRFVRFDAFALPVLVDKKNASSPFLTSDIAPRSLNTLDEAVYKNLFNEEDQLLIVIDEKNTVIKSYGDTTKYLLQKVLNLNLAELLPRPLSVAFDTASQNVTKTNQKVIVGGIKIKHGDKSISVTLSINPLSAKKETDGLLLVVLSEDKSIEVPQGTHLVFDEKIFLDKYTIGVKQELVDLRDKLNSAHLQLDASNENMQSFNEELLSANEEMQSTNEEMQSVNEELHTINADYQLKNKELFELNDDLNNYFRSNINGQLFVNNDLQLMKFSPGTVKLINLLPNDIGRPLSNISTNIKFETIIQDIREVISNGTVITKEIETSNDRWYQIMTMPYIKQANNARSGAIVTFNDITELKVTQLELDKKNESLLRINADLDNFVLTASHDLLGPLGNIELSIGGISEIQVKDPNLNTFLSVIKSSVKKFRSLINDIANIARLENDMIVLEVVDLEDIITNIEWSLDDKIKASGAVINKDLEIKTIFFSKKNMRSILYNLISNSIKFSSKDAPVIDIHTKSEEGNVILSVSDNGIGIPKEGLTKIFDLYGRLHMDVEGHGIGLYLAKKIVHAANGHIKVESEPGKGSKFIIYLKS